jgi:hypothetical protein
MSVAQAVPLQACGAFVESSLAAKEWDADTRFVKAITTYLNKWYLLNSTPSIGAAPE